jgi:hypothetical protein
MMTFITRCLRTIYMKRPERSGSLSRAADSSNGETGLVSPACEKLPKKSLPDAGRQAVNS